MHLFFVIVFGLYFLLLILLLVGWKGVASSREEASLKALITVVIPFRNEENNLHQLIDDLGKINYPADRFEIILVNDHSVDRSVEIVTLFISSIVNFKMLSLPTGKEGKKQAITLAIENATGEIIVTTDADCRVPVKWLHIINNCFTDGRRKMVLGGVRITESSHPFSQWQALEFCSLMGVTSSSSGLGFPTMCNGANLAYLKSAFMEVDGYQGNFEIASGDDEFLMRKIFHRFPEGIYFLAESESVVSTGHQKTFFNFVQQRLRWAGKWKHNSSWIARGLAVFVLLFQISFLLLVALAVFRRIEIQLVILLVGLKLILESFFLYRVSVFLRVKWRTIHFLLLQFVYPVYVIFMGVASLLMTYEWKGRKN